MFPYVYYFQTKRPYFGWAPSAHAEVLRLMAKGTQPSDCLMLILPAQPWRHPELQGL